MPLFRRAERAPTPAHAFSVGVNDHRVTVGGAERGVTMLAELSDYISAVTGGAATPLADGRDPVAILSAKMDHAELVNDTCAVVTLAFEDLVARGVVPPAEVPPQPELPAVPQRAQHYDYIQAAHARAQVRMAWLEQADAVLRAHEVAVLPPLPPEEDRPDRRR